MTSEISEVPDTLHTGEVPSARTPIAGEALRRSTKGDPAASRVVVIDSVAEMIADRLQDEFDVVVRVSIPCEAAELEAVLIEHKPSLILCKASLEDLHPQLAQLLLVRGASILLLARPLYGLLARARVRRCGGLPWVRLQTPGRRRAVLVLKRWTDVLAVVLCAPVVLTLVLFLGVLIRRDGPVLYSQERVGVGGCRFRLLKLRTMSVDAERDTGPVLARPDDARITAVGRVLRRLHLDELPQLWNVLRGDMSLVGPRPERPEFTVQFGHVPHYELRHQLRPGITGISQLTAGYAATAEEKLRCDLLYVNCLSLRLDIKIIMWTVADVLRRIPRG
ncbi:sugar transferase [Streptomyces wuyuanensis]|uniref:sugar transferase n=1 Tax=Streptomyces wuyuanensis TaxID=1196353 RepID=UPI0034339B4D